MAHPASQSVLRRYLIFGVLLVVLPAPAWLLSLVWLVGACAVATGVLLLILAFRVRSLAGDDDSGDVRGARRVPVEAVSDDRRFSEGGDLVKVGDSASNGRTGEANGAQDVRGREVRDREGLEIGTVEDPYVDRDGATSRFLVVDAGETPGLGRRHLLIPTEAVSAIDANRVTLNEDRDTKWRIPLASTRRSRLTARTRSSSTATTATPEFARPSGSAWRSFAAR